MKNVIVIALGGERFAVELRWVREIFTLGHVTPVPTAPAVVAGATNFRGSIMPVLSGPALLAAQGRKIVPGRSPRAGDSVVLLDVEDMRAALSIERIDEVTTLDAVPGQEGVLVDRDGHEAQLIDPPSLLQTARRLVGEKVGEPE